MENPLTGQVGGAWDHFDRVPGSIDDHDTRYLIAKLVALVPVWSRVLDDPRERGLLKRLHAEHPRALFAALQQEAVSPAAKNPGAWLSRTVRVIAGEAS